MSLHWWSFALARSDMVGVDVVWTQGIWVLMLIVACAACGGAHRDQEPNKGTAVYTPSPSFATVDMPFEPLPLKVGGGPAAKLGETLYADTIMSVDGTLTCFSCHDLKKGGTDGLPKAHVSSRDTGQINTGTIFNLAFNFRFNWNGKFVTLLNHINGPVTSKDVMGISWPTLLKRVKGVEAYRREFGEIYSDGLTTENIRHAVTEYQLSLVTPNATFDRYLRGEKDSLNKQELAGYRLFKSLGCASCHQGINIGGNLFAKIGVIGNYFVDRQNAGRGSVTETDYGRYQVTKNESDRHVFRVPSLRNVACTSPYFHDGSIRDLEEAVETMGRYQLGRELTQEQISLLVVFLRTLTGEHEGVPLCTPASPATPTGPT
jgi:cytochrome c peroxidase